MVVLHEKGAAGEEEENVIVVRKFESPIDEERLDGDVNDGRG